MKLHANHLISVFLLSALSAQNLEVVPRIASTWPARERDPYFFHRDPARTQWIYDLVEFTPSQANLRAIAFRSDATLSSNATSLTGAIDLSISPLATTQVTPVFATNRGPSPTRVFQGTISLPGQSQSWPRPWTMPVLFSQPFAYSRGPSPQTLVVEFEKNSTNSSNLTWAMERYSVAPGDKRIALSQTDCYTSAGTLSSAVGHAPWEPIPGGTMSLTFSDFPTNVPSFNSSILLIGTNGPGSLFGGSILMPFVLRRFGVPSPNFCQLTVEPTVTVPLRYLVQSGRGYLELSNLPIPDQPSLYNRKFFVQGIGVDTHPILRTPTLIPTTALEVRIGSGEVALGKTVYGTPSASQGTLFHGVGALQFTW